MVLYIHNKAEASCQQIPCLARSALIATTTWRGERNPFGCPSRFLDLEVTSYSETHKSAKTRDAATLFDALISAHSVRRPNLEALAAQDAGRSGSPRDSERIIFPSPVSQD
jgi:hypothetical protein